VSDALEPNQSQRATRAACPCLVMFTRVRVLAGILLGPSGFALVENRDQITVLADLGVQRFFIQVIGLRGKPAAGKPEKGSQWQVDPQHWLDVVPGVARAAARAGIHVTWPKVFLDTEDVFQCAGQVAENFFIFPNGRVYQCPLCEDYPIHSFCIEDDQLVQRNGLNEDRFFTLEIPEGCVMNKLLQPDNIDYLANGSPRHRISCCLLKQEMEPVVENG